jgi:molybdenum cofactor cytidylyltransferase
VSVTRRVASIVLAAGASTRMGYPKQLIEFDGEPLVRRAARAALDAGAEPVVVVIGANAELVTPVLEDLKSCVTVIVNNDWQSGLASSIRTGVNALRNDDWDGVLITLADQPLVDAHGLRQLIEAFDDEHRIIASSYSDTIGVPALFGKEHMPALLRLEGDAGAGTWLRSHLDSVTQVPLDQLARSVDTPSDVADLLRSELE